MYFTEMSGARSATAGRVQRFCLTIFPGDHSEEVTPVPISNTEVKGLSGDGTAALGRGRVARRRDFLRKGFRLGGSLFLFRISGDGRSTIVWRGPIRGSPRGARVVGRASVFGDGIERCS